ncbi:MAG: hypothetical protein ACFFBP_03380 [Promethearchaeota archaeon]
MKQVKGTMFKMIIKAIKADKSGTYDNILSDKAKEMMNQRILDSIWYPFDIYKECFNALCKVTANDKKEVIIKWGRVESERLMTRIYSQAITEGNIESAIEKYARFHKMVFNFGEIQSELISDNQIIVNYREFEKDFRNFYYIAIGWIDKFIDLCIGKKAQYEILKKSWEGADLTQFKLSWSS